MQIIRQLTGAVILIVILICNAAAAKIIYVDDNATGNNDGTSWQNAYIYIRDALDDAYHSYKPVEIRVAQGTYTPDQGVYNYPGDHSQESFWIRNRVTLAGGYAGVDANDPNTRDIELYETILSGDLYGNDAEITDLSTLLLDQTREENSFSVVSFFEADETAILDGFTISGGHSTRDTSGGGICNEKGNPTITNCKFIGNLGGRDSSGGGMYNYKGNPTITNCKFIGNFAIVCGGMLNNESSPNLTNCTFTGNFSNGRGGGMFNSNSSPTLNNCTFSGNSATEGGGMYNTFSSPTLINCIFLGNMALKDTSGRYRYAGGGMANDDGSSPTLTKCNFNGNSAEYDGGGMWNRDKSNPILTNCQFRGNSAYRAGGICNEESNLTLTNCIFSGNSVTGYGGGILNMGDIITLTNCTFSGNWANYDGWGRGSLVSYDGGAIYNYPGTKITLTNCILWGNMPGQINENANISYSNIEGGWSEGGTGIIDIDPCFVNAGYWDPNNSWWNTYDDFWVDGDYHLKSETGRWNPDTQTWVTDDVTSPCIDAGDPNSQVGDEPFPNGIRINMGAYGGTTEASKSFSDIPEVVNVNDSDNGSQVTLKQGQLLAVTLESNPTTGYSWEPVEKKNSILEQFGDSLYFPSEQDDETVGAGGWEIFYFKSISIGKETLELIYRRPWETDVEPAKTFSIEVTVN